MKICEQCSKNKNDEEFYTIRNKKYNVLCNECTTKNNTARRLKKQNKRFCQCCEFIKDLNLFSSTLKGTINKNCIECEEKNKIKRICKDCNIEKDISEYYFRLEINDYRLNCKECCYNKVKKVQRENIIDQECHSCKEIKLFEDFEYNKYTKKYVTFCNQCIEKHYNNFDLKLCDKCKIEKQANLFAIWKNVCKECFHAGSIKPIQLATDFTTCTNCNEEKQNTYFEKHSGGRYRTICKKCVGADKKIIYHTTSKKLRSCVSRSVAHQLDKCGSGKFGVSCSKYLPYSISELKEHLESLFEPWMNWSNHGVYRVETWDDNDSSTWTWQLDHIIPHSLLPYNSMEDENFKKCWALSNLRPLSAKQNILDGNRRDISEFESVK